MNMTVIEARVQEMQNLDIDELSKIAANKNEDIEVRVAALREISASDGAISVQLIDNLVHDTDVPVDARVKAIWSLGHILVDEGSRLLETMATDKKEHVELRRAAIYLLRTTKEAVKIFISLAFDKSEVIEVRQIALRSFHSKGDFSTARLRDMLEDPKEEELHLDALLALCKVGGEDNAEYVLTALLHGRVSDYAGEEIGRSFKEGPLDDAAIVDILFDLLIRGAWQSTDLNSNLIIDCLAPAYHGGQRDKHRITQLLLEKALIHEGDDRITDIIASLLLSAAHNNKQLVGDRINEFASSKRLESGALRKLRISVGGTRALSSVIDALQTNLRENFEQPIADLNADTRKMWKRTIDQAQSGFKVRLIMSVVVFCLGVLLLVASTWQILFSTLATQQLYGSGVSFVSGLSMTLAITYGGPLRDITRSVSDLGIASAAFIGYVHRVLEISHTFTYHYLKQEITFEEMAKSSDMIEDAMRDTIEMLSKARSGATIKNRQG